MLAEALQVRAGEQLLVHGAGGVTGGMLVSLAARRGAEVIATASPSSHKRVRALGARHVIDYHDERWPEEVLEITGSTGVQAAANAAPRGAADALRAVAAPRTPGDDQFGRSGPAARHRDLGGVRAP